MSPVRSDDDLLMLDAALLQVDPLVLGVGQGSTAAAPEYLNRLFRWSSGTRGYAEAAREYAERGDFASAAQCTARVDQGRRGDLAQELLSGWKEWRAVRAHRIQQATALRSTLEESVAKPLIDAIGMAEAALEALPHATDGDFEALTEVNVALFRDADAALALLSEAEQQAENERIQRERAQRERLLALKQKADAILGHLILDPPTDVAADDIDETQAALTAAYRARRLSDVERLLDRLRAFQRGETPPLPTATSAYLARTSRPRAEPREFEPTRLSTYTAQALGQKPASESTEHATLDLNLWDKSELERVSTHCRRAAFSTDRERARVALGAFLFAEGKRRIAEEPSAAIPFLIDAFRWACSSGSPEARESAAAWMLLALRLFFLSGQARRDLLERMGGRAPRNARAVQDHLRHLDQSTLIAEVTELSIRCGRTAGTVFLRDHILPYVEAHPRTAERLAERWIEHIASPATSAFQTAAAAQQLWTLLESSALTSELDRDPDDLTEAVRAAKNESERRNARREILRATKHAVFADMENFVLADSTVKAIDRCLPWLSHDSSSTPKITQRTLTPSISGTSPRIVVEVRLSDNSLPVRHVTATLDLLDAGERRIGVVENVASIAILSDRAIEVVGNLRGEIPDPAGHELKLRVQYDAHGFDGVKRSLEARSRNLSIAVAEPRVGGVPDNPYMVGKTVDNPERIYGREEQLTAVLQALGPAGGGNVVMVLGERRIGKSTFLHLLANNPEVQQRFLVVLSKFENAPKAPGLGELLRGSVVEEMRRVLAARGISVPASGSEAHLGAAESFRHYIRSVDEQLVAGSRRLLVILDELDQLLENELLGREAVAALRSAIADAKAIRVVLAGATEIMNRHTRTRDDRLFQLAIEIPLPSLSPSGATKLLQDPAKGYFEITGPATERVLQQTNRQPYLLQRVGFDLFQHMQKVGAPIACQLDVEDVLAPIVANGGLYYDFLRYLPDGDSLLIAKAIARLQIGLGYVGIEDVRRELGRRGRRLLRNDLVERLTDIKRLAPLVVEENITTRQYRLRVGLFARHLRLLEDEPER